MSLTMQYTGTLVIETCCHDDCQMTFAMPQDFVTQKRRDHKTWYCPRGHSHFYNGESDLERAKRLQRAAQEDAAYAWTAVEAARDQARATARSNAALRGVITRARNKITAGVCPVGNCRRPFSNVREHIQHEHPGWHLTDPETGKKADL